LVVFKKSSVAPEYISISGNGQHPPLLEFTADEITILEEGNFELAGSSQPVSVNNKIATLTVDGEWEVSFTKGWGAPEKAVFPKLISWTESETEGIKYYSGTATYKKTFLYNGKPDPAKKEKIYLDLGEISKVADVWLNGEHLGISWAKPHRFEVTNLLKSGENTITAEIANVWSNRLKGDALTGQKFTNTNITNTIIPVSTIEPGDQKRIPWAEVPLIESGLLGPVTIQMIVPVTTRK
jgi:hypothetical protein